MGEQALSVRQVVLGRPFTDPERTAEDLAVLRALGGLLARRARRDRGDGWARWADRAGRYRLLVPSWERLRAASGVPGVGFLGQLRPAPRAAFPPRLEPAAAESAAAGGWLLAYLNARLFARPGVREPSYANLVLLADRAAAAALATDPSHAEAVGRAPASYRSIRIHRLGIVGSVTGRPRVRVLQTRYLDFATSPAWRAVRPGPGGSRAGAD